MVTTYPLTDMFCLGSATTIPNIFTEVAEILPQGMMIVAVAQPERIYYVPAWVGYTLWVWRILLGTNNNASDYLGAAKWFMGHDHEAIKATYAMGGREGGDALVRSLLQPPEKP
mgnify:FL=1